ncbi:hypothetical protein niasHT_015722 [Heterodera trifolii]|uniref:DNA-directed DNA polymerase n=1 Tax=Heterodera trifolii TaxID=157864 RepID=A0ABD2L4U1_9BILA
MLLWSLPFGRSFPPSLLRRSASSFTGLTSEQFMKNPTNEPVLEYRKGSAESDALEKELQKMWAEPMEVPLAIGGEKTFRKEKAISVSSASKWTKTMGEYGENHQKFTPKNIQSVSRCLHKHLFGEKNLDCLNFSADEGRVEACLELPRLHDNGNLMEHFRAEASQQLSSYEKLLNEATWMVQYNKIPRRPKKWAVVPGWTAYDVIDWNSVPRSVPFPDEELLFFDVEVCMKDGRLPTLAVALSTTKWYSWCSERLADPSTELPGLVLPEHLIPMGDLGQKSRLVIGHNVAFDRTFIREQYYLQETAMRFWDTMSMHIAIGGMADHQRDLFNKSENVQTLAKLCFSRPGQPEGGPEIALEALTKRQLSRLKEFRKIVREWKKRTCKNSLEAIYTKYCSREKALIQVKNNKKEEENETEEATECETESKKQSEWDKRMQSFFKTATIDQIRSNVQVLFDYCASDVQATQAVFRKLYPVFKNRFPHPVTFCGMLEMGNPYLPITSNWRHFFEKCEKESSNMKDKTAKDFVGCARSLIEQLDEEIENGIRKFELDPWLWTSDWSRIQKRPQWPQWYLGLFKRFQDAEVPLEILTADLIKMNTREIPRIFGLCYGPYPLFYKFSLGWGFLVPTAEDFSQIELPKFEKVLLRRNEHVNFPVKEIHELIAQNRNRNVPNIPLDKFKRLTTVTRHFAFYRLPHPSGRARNVGTPFDKTNHKNFEEGVLHATRFGDLMREFLASASVTRFWGNYRDRYNEELSIWLDEQKQIGAIVPSVIPAGTVTRRATHKLWLTSANPKENVVGSDLKSMIQCSDGWKLVGADVDSQEQWLAAIFGDSFQQSRRAGATPFSNMLLAGSKSDGTDLHSVVGKEVGITRNQAKTLNYARLYGSGRLHAEQYMTNQGITQAEAKRRARKLFETTKGRPARYFKLSESGGKMMDEFLASHPNLVRHVQQNFTVLNIGGKQFLRTNLPLNDTYSVNGIDPFVAQFEQWLLLTKWEKHSKRSIVKMRKALYEGDVVLNFGGYESQTFNWLTVNAYQLHPTTPVLKCRLSQALEQIQPAMAVGVQPANLHKFNSIFKRTIANWFVQSSAVDFLHLLLVSMRWLCREYEIPARYVISIHDEVRYLVPERDKYRCALC